ncbi:MAG: hypothetical protein GEV11_05440 [Streptosporangiales bacterium]|nr:hypothetical protein [Streptosporangiales bacterium]
MMLTAHVVGSVGWLGAAYVNLMLVVTALVTADVRLRDAAYLVMGVLDPLALIPLGLVALITGVVLGLGTRYGLFRYYWVTAKLVAAVVLLVVPFFARMPSVREAVAVVTAGGDLGRLGHDVLPPSIAATVVLTLATIISVYKPWGPIRKRRPARVSSADSRRVADAASAASTPR